MKCDIFTLTQTTVRLANLDFEMSHLPDAAAVAVDYFHQEMVDIGIGCFQNPSSDSIAVEMVAAAAAAAADHHRAYVCV